MGLSVDREIGLMGPMVAWSATVRVKWGQAPRYLVHSTSRGTYYTVQPEVLLEELLHETYRENRLHGACLCVCMAVASAPPEGVDDHTLVAEERLMGPGSLEKWGLTLGVDKKGLDCSVF